MITPATDNAKWVRFWEIPSNSNPTKTYRVAENTQGEFGCSCPHWIYRRAVCSHIRQVAGEKKSASPIPKPVEVPAQYQGVSLADLPAEAFIEW